MLFSYFCKKAMYYIPIIIHILFVYFEVVNCDNETTNWSIDLKGKAPCNSGAARHMCGSNTDVIIKSKRNYNNRIYGSSSSSIYRFRHTTPLPQYDSNPEQFSHGRLITEPLHPVPPPFDASYRVIGGVRVPGIGADTDVYGSRSMGERHDDGSEMWKTYDRYGGQVVHHFGNHLKHSDMRETEANLGHMKHHPDEMDDEEQICTLACLANEFLCTESCMCISKFTRCDGIINCEEGEDEKDCTLSNEQIINKMKTECESTEKHVICPGTFACISMNFLCDGDDDCGDYSDETHCGSHVNCSEDQFECANGLCIQKPWVCDGDNDCKDFSDELNCTTLFCDMDEFQCADGNCVSASFRCDGEFDCYDHSDEINCQTPIPDCPEGEFKCKGSIGGSVTGPGNRCILMRFRCDGDNDCGDWSDEEGCENMKSTSCTSSEFKCDDGICIPAKWKCDFEQDCDGGEDEKNCGDVKNKVDKRTCADDEFKCKGGRCILKTWLCDGYPDCKHFEDEANCTFHCEIGQFSCPIYKNMTNARVCVEQKHICDGLPDCLYGEDEKNCPKIKECDPNSKCEQLCAATNTGTDECVCNIGYVLHENKRNCTDIDECEFTHNPVCSQECINTPGSFRCACTTGYVLRPDLRTCKAMGGAVKLIMANRADIRQVSLSNNKYTSIIKGLHNAISIDFHYERGLLFWSDISTDVIKMAFMNASEVKDIVKWGLESPGGIAVDWIHDLIFWTDSGTKRIEVATFDGSLRAAVIANNLDKPRAIVVHPGEAMVFWTDWGNGISTSTGPNPKIERSYMDGSDRKTIILEGVFWPNGLAIDYSSNRLYWADAKHHVIESSNLDGTDRKKILSMHLPHPFALTLFEDQMFWTDWNTKSISTANKITGTGFRHVHVDLHFPMDIHSYHPSRQPNFTSHCILDNRGRKGGCSHLCLPNRDSRNCGCPIGLSLEDDQRTCTKIPDKLLLISRKKDIRLRQIQSKNMENEVDMVVPIDGLKSTIAIDWCSRTDSIFWTDVGRGVISRAHLNGSNQEVVIQANLISPAGLALDWITNKVYWTDMGTNRIEVATTDGKQRALVIWQGLNKPRDIVVNPIDGIMFWSDCGDMPMIETADMDGANRRSIVSKNIKYPNGLSVDHLNTRLYFVDSGTKTLEYVNFDGTGRKIVVEDGLEHPFGIDIYDRKVYWTDWKTNSVQMADKITGRNKKTIIANMTDLMDVRVFHRDRRSITNKCSGSNGDCSHMCLLNPLGFKCTCPIGVKLSKDGRTCNDGPSEYIIFAHRIDIRQISLDIDYLIDVVLPLPLMSNVMAVDVDRLTGDIFWSDTLEDVIVKSTSDGSYIQQVITESIDSVDGLVVDPIGRKLYFTDGGRHTVEVCDLNGRNRDVLVWQDLETPRGIAVDYASGYLFWSDWGIHPKIERSFMDGDRRHKIVFDKLGWPNGLTTDKYEKRIYWTDAQLKHIESCDYDGNYRKIIIGSLPHPYGIAVSHHYVYWTDWKTTALHVFDKQNSSQRIIRNSLEGLMEVKVIEKEDNIIENACGRNNGNCSHLCLRNPKGFKCRCPTGTKLKVDSKTECENLPESYLLIALRSGIGRISLDTPDMFDVVLPINGVYGAVVLDYHYNQSKIFFADVNIDVIKSVDMTNASKSTTIVSTGLMTPNGLAVDWIANNIFWSDTGAKVIEVARLDGSCRKVLIKDDLTDPRSMIVYPKRGFLFWSDWGQPARIERSYMDGSDRKVIIDNDLGFPTGLAIDFETLQLYWTDALEDRIGVSKLDGRHRSTVVPQASHPFGVTIFESNIFWTDWYNKSVFRADKVGNHKAEEVRHGLSGALDMRSVSKSRQPNDWTPCADGNGGCTHLCLFRFNSYKCECPDKKDTRICKTEPDHYVPMRQDNKDYNEANNDDIENDNGSYPDDKNYKARMFIYAIAIVGGLLIVVLAAILFLVLNSKKKKENRTPIGSTRSVLTFSNPNYNGADGTSVSEPRSTIWKRIKYDKAQDRVYEESYLPQLVTSINVMAITHQTPSTSSISPSSTIG